MTLQQVLSGPARSEVITLVTTHYSLVLSLENYNLEATIKLYAYLSCRGAMAFLFVLILEESDSSWSRRRRFTIETRLSSTLTRTDFGEIMTTVVSSAFQIPFCFQTPAYKRLGP